MADVLGVTAGEVGDPVSELVLAQSDDGLVGHWVARAASGQSPVQVMVEICMDGLPVVAS